MYLGSVYIAKMEPWQYSSLTTKINQMQEKLLHPTSNYSNASQDSLLKRLVDIYIYVLFYHIYTYAVF